MQAPVTYAVLVLRKSGGHAQKPRMHPASIALFHFIPGQGTPKCSTNSVEFPVTPGYLLHEVKEEGSLAENPM